ncbi:imidazole glycerol phosphate synthase subunit HisH [Minwuia thermotolerans]|uniref:Imidazole glycerol phosphate synthase subunit HisH n=1 Tax=Minwuia thermotolerans TaxID=2056226 RepID=A0A2M9G681_9PROT|nr:imidazole glycerol phosphate synthase subunit HisH [Minwuia thermotolerans]PJK31210.1 imidazole glycerol phosphate synthase subunit HisH [Minwuia thermotolerans]
MAGPSVSILDYGVGNLRSVARAFEVCGAAPILASSPKEAARAERLVIPGVGAFGSCVAAIRKRGFHETIEEVVRLRQRPVMGICVGMQMLLDESEEFGPVTGFGYLPGGVVGLAKELGETRRKVPHVGWAALIPPEENVERWNGTPLEGVRPGDEVYFVHSFHAAPANRQHYLAGADYLGDSVCAAVHHENLVGFQFHPEKSGPVGLAILRRFLEMG